MPGYRYKIGPGWFVDNKGLKIGQHKGFPYYTIGQRKGLEIALGRPAYVLRINAEKNTVMLGDAEELKTEYMLVEDYQITDMQELMQCKDLAVRIRYRSKPIPCRVAILDENTCWCVSIPRLLPLLRDSLPYFTMDGEYWEVLSLHLNGESVK